MLTLDHFQLLDWRLSRVFDVHVRCLMDALEAALQTIKPNEPETYQNSVVIYSREVQSCLPSYLREMRSELAQSLEKICPAMAIEDHERTQELVAKFFDLELYQNRLTIYVDSLERHLARYGISMPPKSNSLDLALALHTVATANFVRGSLAVIADDLALLAARETSPNSSNPKLTPTAAPVLKLEPSIYGIGLNLPNLYRRLSSLWKEK